MKKILIGLLMMILILCSFTGFSKQKVKVAINNANSVRIFYGVNSYAPNISDKNITKTLSNYFNNLTFESTEKKMDFSTQLRIEFSKGEKHIATLSVDKNNVFWLNGDTKCYKIATGKFNYNAAKDIYEKSKKVDIISQLEYGKPVHVTIAWNNYIYEVTDVILSSQEIGTEIGLVSRQVSPKPEANGDIARNTTEGPTLIHTDGGALLYEIKGIDSKEQIGIERLKGMYYKCKYIGKLK